MFVILLLLGFLVGAAEAQDLKCTTCIGTATIKDDSITPDKIMSTGQTDEYVLTYESSGDTVEWSSVVSTVYHELLWFFPGTPTAGVQVARGLIPESVTGCVLVNSRISVNTVASTSTTYNIQRCTTSAGNCTATSNIYSSAVTLNSSTQSVAGGTPNTTTCTAGDAFRVDLVSVGTSLADVTVALTFSCAN